VRKKSNWLNLIGRTKENEKITQRHPYSKKAMITCRISSGESSDVVFSCQNLFIWIGHISKTWIHFFQRKTFYIFVTIPSSRNSERSQDRFSDSLWDYLSNDTNINGGSCIRIFILSMTRFHQIHSRGFFINFTLFWLVRSGEVWISARMNWNSHSECEWT
jgi:hypothetical protein